MQILVIEDSAEDAFLILQAFTTVDDCQAFVCRNTLEAKSYLQGEGMFFDRRKYPTPDAIISDLGLSGESGLEFIQWLRTVPEFFHIPVYVLSGAPSTDDLKSAQNLGVLRVLQKPNEFRILERTLAQLAADVTTRRAINDETTLPVR